MELVEDGQKLMIKKIVYKMIQSNRILMKLFVLINNNFQGDWIEANGMLIRKNRFTVNGINNSIKISEQCSIQNVIAQIKGDENLITIDDTELNGNSDRRIFILGDNNQITIGKGCKLTNISFFISGNNNRIYISENCSGIDVEFHIEQNNNEIFIGKNTTMHGRGTRTVHFALDEGTKIVVGEDCMFSNDIQIRSSDSHSIVDLQGKRLNSAKDIVIGNHCWIGLRSMLLKGTEIADNTMVAGGSICTKKYNEKNVILAGNPAKVVKKNINWDRKFL